MGANAHKHQEVQGLAILVLVPDLIGEGEGIRSERVGQRMFQLVQIKKVLYSQRAQPVAGRKEKKLFPMFIIENLARWWWGKPVAGTLGLYTCSRDSSRKCPYTAIVAHLGYDCTYLGCAVQMAEE